MAPDSDPPLAIDDPNPDPPRPPPDVQDKWAAIAFGGYLAASAVLILAVLGRHAWFFHDEWGFLVERVHDGWADLFEPHNHHWTTVPVLIYKALFGTFGLRSYLPYQAVVVVAHLGTAALLRVVMRRAGVGAWTATLVAGTFVLLGSGERNIVGGFQITFTGALALGLVHLVLADHEGGVDWRDAVGLVAGALALMCSAVGVAMAVTVGLALWMRRGWRVALLHTVTLAAVFLTWYLVVDPAGPRSRGLGLVDVAGRVAKFAAAGVLHAFDALGYLPWVGALLGLLLVAGLVLAWLPLAFRDFRRQAALPAALLAGGLLFLVLGGLGRWDRGPEVATTSRYTHLVVAFLLPALAVAADAVVRRWPVAWPAVVVVLLLGVPGNISAFGHDGGRTEPFFDHYEQMFVALARSPLADEAPPDLVPEAGLAPRVTIGWLRQRYLAGELPDVGAVDPAIEEEVAIRLGLLQQRAMPPDAFCQVFIGSVALSPEVGARYGFREQIEVTSGDVPAEDQEPIRFDPRDGKGLEVLVPGLNLRVERRGGSDRLTFCS